MLKHFNGENVFQGKIIEVHIGTLLADQAFTEAAHDKLFWMERKSYGPDQGFLKK